MTGRLRRVAAACLAGSCLLLVLLHALEPALTPDRHVISEYGRGPDRPVLSAALLLWAFSLVLLAAQVWVSNTAPVPRAVSWLLLVAAGGLLLATTFKTQAVAGVVSAQTPRTTAGRLHDLGSGAATLALLAGAAIGWWSTRQAGGSWPRLCAAVVIAAVVLQAALLAVGPEVGGIRQRLLILLALGWEAALLRRS